MKSLKSTLALLAIVSLGFGCASVTSAEYGDPTTETIEQQGPDRVTTGSGDMEGGTERPS